LNGSDFVFVVVLTDVRITTGMTAGARASSPSLWQLVQTIGPAPGLGSGPW
jgi:hypothetical protein